MDLQKETKSLTGIGDKKKHYAYLIVGSYALVAVVLALKGDLPTHVLAFAGFLGAGLGLAFLPLIAMRFGGNTLGWFVLAIFGLGYSQGELNWLDQQAVNSTTTSYQYRGRGCEFTVIFPAKPVVETFTLPQTGDYEQALWTSEVPEDSTALRTECIPITPLHQAIQQHGPKQFMLDQLATFASDNGLSSVSYKYSETALGHIGSARGVKSIQGTPVTYDIVAVAGKESFLTLYAGGRSSTFPQKEIAPFIDSVSR